MKKNTFFFAAALILLLIGSCTLQKDLGEGRKAVDDEVLQAEEKQAEVADLLAEAEYRIQDSLYQEETIDRAVRESDLQEEIARSTVAGSQTGSPGDYILGIGDGARTKCGPERMFWELLEKAQPDEKFYCPCGGNIFNPFYPQKPPPWWWDPNNPDVKDPPGFVQKTNEAYVWGLVKCGDKLFFGTAPNVHCLVLQGYLGYTGVLGNEGVYVCEGDCSEFRDWRPPSMYMYDLGPRIDGCPGTECPGTGCPGTERLFNITESVPIQMLMTTAGIRAAWTCGGAAYLAGPAVNLQAGGLESGINVFAFDCCTGRFLGAKSLPQYNNVRKGITVKGNVYVGVGGPEGGAVLRWTGGLSTRCAVDQDRLFEFVEVGSQMDGSVAELCSHEGRIFVSTWPKLDLADPKKSMEAGVWMSPKLGPCLGAEDALPHRWEKVWSVSDFEPDPVTALSYGGGAVASFNGWLYWGTMHVPLAAAVAHFTMYGEPENGADVAAALLGTWRAISIFRGRNFDDRRWGREIDLRWGKRPDPRFDKMCHKRWKEEFKPRFGKRHDPRCAREIQLLYGERFLPVYVPGRGWRLWPNKMAVSGMQPKYGHSGFGNLFNNYCWTMAVYGNRLYVGTMDWSFLLFGTLGIDIPQNLSYGGYDLSILNRIGILPPVFGADLYCFEGNGSEAKPVSLDGMGNPMNYGIRTMEVGGALYLGSANPMNLSPDGGWELIRFVYD